jgi:serine/threonine-protein kinase RsbW
VSGRAQHTYTNDIGELRRMSASWCEWAASIGLPTEIQDRGELCLNEAVANIILHSSLARAITITLDRETDVVRMTIADDGEPFDPLTHPAADRPRTLDEARPGGLGLHILRTSPNGVAYRRVGDRNELTLTLTR